MNNRQARLLKYFMRLMLNGQPMKLSVLTYQKWFKTDEKLQSDARAMRRLMLNGEKVFDAFYIHEGSMTAKFSSTFRAIVKQKYMRGKAV